MKIDDSQLIEGLKQVTQGQQVQRSNQKQGTRKAARENNQSETDNVNLSSKARQYQKIKKAAMEAPDIRREKVDSIRKEIEAGTYNVRGEKVAARIVQESLIDTFL